MTEEQKKKKQEAEKKKSQLEAILKKLGLVGSAASDAKKRSAKQEALMRGK